MWRSGGLRHTAGSAESCCLPALTRFTGCSCTGPDRHMRERAGPHGSVLSPGRHRRVATRRDARAAESARLESVCGATHRGFESHSLRRTVRARPDRSGAVRARRLAQQRCLGLHRASTRCNRCSSSGPDDRSRPTGPRTAAVARCQVVVLATTVKTSWAFSAPTRSNSTSAGLACPLNRAMSSRA